jgi:hypothetical protein
MIRTLGKLAASLFFAAKRDVARVSVPFGNQGCAVVPLDEYTNLIQTREEFRAEVRELEAEIAERDEADADAEFEDEVAEEGYTAAEVEETVAHYKAEIARLAMAYADQTRQVDSFRAANHQLQRELAALRASPFVQVQRRLRVKDAILSADTDACEIASLGSVAGRDTHIVTMTLTGVEFEE